MKRKGERGSERKRERNGKKKLAFQKKERLREQTTAERERER